MGQLRGRIAVLAVLAVVALSVGALLGRSVVEEPPAPSIAHDDVPAPNENTVKVHVSGMVVAPGVVDVAGDAIVADAIDAAGGLLTGALVDQLNLAAPITAGAQIVVPGPEADAAGVPAEGDGLVSLNQATTADLETLPGVGPVLAGRIVSFREEDGGFETVEDLLQVPGIGEAKLAAIRDLVRP